MDFDNQSMTLEEAITIIREIDPSAEETNSRRAETLILQAVHDGANVEFPSDNISLHMAVETKAWAMVWAAEPLRKVNDVVPGSDFRACRNELCLRCGQYKTKHLGSCDGCRWEKI